MEKAELNKLVAETFKNYPGYKELYATADGNVFLTKVNAENHASVANMGIITYKADEMEGIEAETESMGTNPEPKKKTKKNV
jgi:ABC-type lipoprotein release transport system permease subunit